MSDTNEERRAAAVGVARQEHEELVRTLEDAPRLITQLVSDLGEHGVSGRPTGKVWSAVEHICHLRDIETEGYAVRITKLLTEDEPFLNDLDGDRLAAERGYINQDLGGALEAFINARAVNVEAVRDLSADQLSRAGVYENIGPLTLGQLLRNMREHDREHINELTRLRSSVTPTPDAE